MKWPWSADIAKVQKAIEDLERELHAIDRECDTQIELIKERIDFSRLFISLDKCPFCGHCNTLVIDGSESGPWMVKCRNCDCSGPEGNTEEYACLAWNRRS